MASSAEKLASSVNFGLISRADDLKRRLWFVLGALIAYRIGTYIPLPGLDSAMMAKLFGQRSTGGILDVFNLFSGGAFQRMTIFALNVMPYITMSIIVQLLTALSPSLTQLKKEGEAGRRKLAQYTRYGAVFMATFQGFGIANFLQGSFGDAVLNPGWFFTMTTIVTLVGGTIFLMWLGEQITQRGIGNGTSLIIFAGIVAELPRAIATTFELGRTGAISTVFILAVLILVVGLLWAIVFMERSHRRVIVQYPKRQIGNKQFMGESSHLPLKLNTAGVIPPIFASSLLLFPATIAGFSAGKTGTGWAEFMAMYLGHGKPLYIFMYVALIAFFCFFYTKHVFNPVETAENLKQNGGFVPGIRPGKNTADYLEYLLTRLNVLGAIYLSIVCVIPEILIAEYSIPFYLGGTSLLIVVNVTMDTIGQVHSHLIAHQYEGLMKKAKLRGGSKGSRR